MSPCSPARYYWVFGNNWDYRDFDFDHDQAEVERQKGFLNALDTDLTPFASHGGKLIMFHGFADALISPQMTIDYYLLVQRALQQEDQDQVQALADEQSFFRLFLAPGMGHCSGGPGPNAFGQLGGTPVPTDAQHDGAEIRRCRSGVRIPLPTPLSPFYSYKRKIPARCSASLPPAA
jgi:feruloyl esterase